MPFLLLANQQLPGQSSFGGIQSQEAFGIPRIVGGRLTITPVGIVSAQAFGTTRIGVTGPVGGVSESGDALLSQDVRARIDLTVVGAGAVQTSAGALAYVMIADRDK